MGLGSMKDDRDDLPAQVALLFDTSENLNALKLPDVSHLSRAERKRKLRAYFRGLDLSMLERIREPRQT